MRTQGKLIGGWSGRGCVGGMGPPEAGKMLLNRSPRAKARRFNRTLTTGAILAAAAAVTDLGSIARATTFTWDGSPNTGAKQWTNANMWNPNQAPDNNGTADLVVTLTN